MIHNTYILTHSRRAAMFVQLFTHAILPSMMLSHSTLYAVMTAEQISRYKHDIHVLAKLPQELISHIIIPYIGRLPIPQSLELYKTLLFKHNIRAGSMVNNKHMLIFDEENCLKKYNVHNGKIESQLKLDLDPEYKKSVSTLYTSPAGDSYVISLREIDWVTIIPILDTGTVMKQLFKIVVRDDEGSFSSELISILPNLQYILRKEKQLTKYDMSTGKILCQYKPKDKTIYAIKLSDDQTTLETYLSGKTIDSLSLLLLSPDNLTPSGTQQPLEDYQRSNIYHNIATQTSNIINYHQYLQHRSTLSKNDFCVSPHMAIPLIHKKYISHSLDEQSRKYLSTLCIMTYSNLFQYHHQWLVMKSNYTMENNDESYCMLLGDMRNGSCQQLIAKLPKSQNNWIGHSEKYIFVLSLDTNQCSIFRPTV